MRRRRMSRKTVFARALSSGRMFLDFDVDDYFNPTQWSDFHDIGGDEGLRRELASLAEEGMPHSPLNYRHSSSSLEKDIEEILGLGLRQGIRAKNLNQLNALLEKLDEKRKDHGEESAWNNRYEHFSYLRERVERTLKEIPDIKVDHEHSWGVLHTRSDEQMLLDGIVRLGPVFGSIVNRLEAVNFPGISTIRRLSKSVEQGVFASYHGKDRMKFLQANLTINGERALFPALALYPEMVHAGWRFEGFPSIMLDRNSLEQLVLDQNSAEQLWGFPVDEARKIMRYIASGLQHHEIPEEEMPSFPVSVRPFYWRLLSHPDWRWCGVQGCLNTVLQERVGTEKEDTFGDTLPDMLQEMGLEGHLANVPAQFIAARFKPRYSGEGIDLLNDDPFTVLALPQYWTTYQKAVKKIRRLFPNAKEPDFEEMVSHSGLNYEMTGLEWVVKKYNKRSFGANYQHPLLIRLVEQAGKNAFFPRHGRIYPIETLSRFVGTLEEVQPRIPAEHFAGMVKYVAEFTDESARRVSRFVEIFSRDGPWKKFGDDTPENKLKRSRINQISREQDMRERNLDLFAAEEEQASEVLEKLSNEYAWRKVKKEVPYGKAFLDGLIHNPHDTYKMYRQIAIEFDFSRFVTGIMKQLLPCQVDEEYYDEREEGWRHKENLTEVYQYYATLEQRLNRNAGFTSAMNTELGTLSTLQEQLARIRGKSDTAEAMRQSRVRKGNQIVSRQINKTLRLAWEQSYAVGLQEITGRTMQAEQIPADVRHAVAMYFVTDQEDLKQHIADMITARLDRAPYRHFTAPENASYLETLANKGMDVHPWVNGMAEKYIAHGKDLSYVMRQQKHHEREIFEIGAKFRIAADTVEGVYRQAQQTISDANALADLQTQMDALKQLRGRLGTNTEREVTIYVETDPMAILQMGQRVDGSCLAIGRGNTYSAVSNALDINKRVLYAVSEGKTIGRKLIALTDNHNIVQFRTYYASDLALDEPFERFTRKLADQMGAPLANEGKISTLVSSEWYNDGIERFSHVPIGNTHDRVLV